jgi:hypothetical protein
MVGAIRNPMPIFRFMHIDNLKGCLDRGGMYAPTHWPDDGAVYRTIHNEEVQNARHVRRIPCGPGGTIHDYVSFYFGYLSPMMLNLKTGRVPGYNEGQTPLIYLESSAQAVSESGGGFVFSDGHGIATFTEWFDDLGKLDRVDWNMVYQRYWGDNIDDMDRQRRKQAEFLVHRFCSWDLIERIAVINAAMQARVEAVLAEYAARMRRAVTVQRDWYYH